MLIKVVVVLKHHKLHLHSLRDDLILFVEFLFGHSDSGPGILEKLPIRY